MREAGARGFLVLEAEKLRGKCEICPKCASPSSSIYDHRVVNVRDEPIRRKQVLLKIRKRRYFCKQCKKVFTEPVPGIMPRMRTTQKYRRSILWACENFSDLKKVRKTYRCSSALIYRVLFEQLERKLREYRYPWPSKFARGFRKHPRQRECRTCGVDPLSDTYKSFVKGFFPNAKCVADKFHVLRLLHPHINRRRKDVTGDRRTLPIRKLLLVSGKKLDYSRKYALSKWLESYPELREVYSWKERMHGFYRIKGHKRARIAFQRMTDDMAHSLLPEIKRLYLKYFMS